MPRDQQALRRPSGAIQAAGQKSFAKSKLPSAPQARSSAWLSLRWPASTPCPRASPHQRPRPRARALPQALARPLERRHLGTSCVYTQVQQASVTCGAATALLGSRQARGKLVFPVSRDVLPKKVWADGSDLKCWAGPGRASSCQRVDQRPRRGCRPVAVPAAGHDAGWRAGGLGLFRRPPAAAAVLAQRQRETQGSASSNQSRAGTAGGAPHLRVACA